MPTANDDDWEDSVTGTDTDRTPETNKNRGKSEIAPINWRALALIAFVGLGAYYSGWMSKTLYSDLTGTGPEIDRKVKIFEAYSFYIAAKDGQGDSRTLAVARQKLLKSLEQSRAMFSFTPGEDVRTVGIEPEGPRIAFSDGTEILLPIEIAEVMEEW